MTHRAAGRGRRIPKLWLLPALMLAAITGATYAGVFSRSLVLDLAAWWLVWLLIVLLAVVARGRRWGRVRVSGLVPLFAAAALGLFTYGHVAGWPVMPSASQSLVGPQATSGSVAALSARIDGELVVKPGSDHLYEVHPIRRGGDIGVPEAIEQTQGSAISVVLRPPADPGFYEFSGWDLTLSQRTEWNLTLEGQMDADLAGLELSGLQVGGSGVLRLGGTVEAVPVNVSGNLELSVPGGVAIRVIGQAEVPGGWEQTSDGWRSPASGDGWVVSVAANATVVLTEH